MSKFSVFMLGSGEGCDYTIGCNQKLVELKAKTREEALLEVAKVLDYHGAGSPEHRMKKVLLFEGEPTVFDYDAWCEVRAEARRAEETAEAEKEERAQFERLKKKFS